MFFHCIIFAKQGQSHRPTGRGAGSRAATRKPLIPLADSVVRTLGRGPGARGRARRRAGGSARTWADIDVGGPGIDGQGIERQGIGRQGAGQPTGLDGDRYRAVAHGPGIGPVRFRAQGPERWGRDSLKIAPGPGQRKGPPGSIPAGQ